MIGGVLTSKKRTLKKIQGQYSTKTPNFRDPEQNLHQDTTFTYKPVAILFKSTKYPLPLHGTERIVPSLERAILRVKHPIHCFAALKTFPITKKK
jgi:hypothetical protein